MSTARVGVQYETGGRQKSVRRFEWNQTASPLTPTQIPRIRAESGSIGVYPIVWRDKVLNVNTKQKSDKSMCEMGVEHGWRRTERKTSGQSSTLPKTSVSHPGLLGATREKAVVL